MPPAKESWWVRPTTIRPVIVPMRQPERLVSVPLHLTGKVVDPADDVNSQSGRNFPGFDRYVPARDRIHVS